MQAIYFTYDKYLHQCKKSLHNYMYELQQAKTFCHTNSAEHDGVVLMAWC